MKFYETELKGAYIIELEKFEDERGFFTRVWDKKIMQDQGLKSDLVQMSFSFSKKKGTLRGMHFQEEPFREVKIVKCIQGKIFDVIIDLRVESRTYKKWIGIELSADKQKMIYVPEGFAHGFQTLEDNTHVLYQMSNWFSPEHEKGIRWDDKDFNIKWPITNLIISKKDLSHKKEEY
jgi:dTDP-4-dehydrorhamnose 3,5-epimerase|tara:strand:- start:2000 stop:2530 length:531 start_codon:yes stop_codon:yes gene_type:complete